MLRQLQGWNRFVPLILQLLLGGIFIPHGAQKIFGAFGGSGMTGFTDSLQKAGITPAVFWAWVVACLEFFGGLFVFFGFLTRVCAALFVVEMVVAIVKVNWARGFFWLKGGLEFPLVLAVIALAVLVGGPSFLSVDRAVGVEKRSA